MAVVELVQTEQCTHFFVQAIKGNVNYWRNFIADHPLNEFSLREERELILRAISFGLQLNSEETATPELILAFSPYMERQGYLEPGEQLISRAVKVTRQQEVILAKLLIEQARLCNLLTRYDEAIHYSQQGSTLAHKWGDVESQARAQQTWVWALTHQRHYEAARQHLNLSLGLSRQCHNRWLEANALNQLGVIAWGEKQLEVAHQHFLQAQKIWHELADQRCEAYLLFNMGGNLLSMGRVFDEVLHYYERSLELVQGFHDRLVEARILRSIAVIHQTQTDYEAAEAMFNRSLTIYSDIGYVVGEMLTLTHFSQLFYQLEHYEVALKHIQQAWQLAQTISHQNYQTSVRLNLARTLMAMGEVEQAKSHFQALVTASKLYTNGKLEAIAGLAEIAYRTQEWSQAEELAHELVMQLLYPLQKISNTLSMKIYLVTYQILHHAQNPRALEVVQFSYDMIRFRANRVASETKRAKFLQQPTYQKLLAVWGDTVT